MSLTPEELVPPFPADFSLKPMGLCTVALAEAYFQHGSVVTLALWHKRLAKLAGDMMTGCS